MLTEYAIYVRTRRPSKPVKSVWTILDTQNVFVVQYMSSFLIELLTCPQELREKIMVVGLVDFIAAVFCTARG